MKQKPDTNIGKHIKRSANAGEFITLSDGRKLFKPPSGGKFTKREIESAVRLVANKRRSEAKTG